MIIPVKVDRGVIRIQQEFASAVPEFGEVLNDPKLGASYLAYVIYSLDPADDNLYSHLPEEIRKKEVADSLKLDASLLKDKKVADAWKKYKNFCDHNISYKYKESYMGGMRKISDYVDATKKVDDATAKKFADVLEMMPSILKGKEELDKLGSKEQAKKGKVTADRKLTLKEQRLS